MTIRTRCAMLIAAVCLLPLAAGAAAPKPVDTLKGYGPAPFGTRWERARTLFPGAAVLPEGKSVGAPTVGGPFVHRLYLTNQHVEGLAKPVNVELRFWKKKLWVVQVYWGDNAPADVVAMLTKRLGPSLGNDPNAPIWADDFTQTTVTMPMHTYGTADLALSAEAQVWLKKVIRGEWTAASPAELDEMEERTPAPTPGH